MTKGKAYLLLQALVCIALAVFLSFSAIEICQEGLARKAEHPMESIYRPKDVEGKFRQAAPLFFAGLGLLMPGLILGVKDEGAEKPVKDASFRRDLVTARLTCPSAVMLAERRRQKRLMWIGLGLFALCMAPILVYLLNPVHFPQEDLEGMFFGLVRVFLPWTAAGLGLLSVCSVLREKSIIREIQAAREQLKIQAVQEQLKKEKAAGSRTAPGPAASLKKKGVLQAAVIIAAVVLIIAGVHNKSARDVLYKAVTICTECIGLG